MNINSKFIYLKRRTSFDDIKNLIPEGLNPIIFIEDTSQLYTCGTFFNLGYPDVKVSEISGQIKVDIGQENFYLSTTGESLSIRKGEGNKIIINSSALTKVDTNLPLEWDEINKKLLHTESGVTAGEYGQSLDIVNASIITIPNITVNKFGHITSASVSTVQIRDYVEQIAPNGNLNVERNILESYNEASNITNSAQVRKTNGLTFNDSTKKLSVEGGINSKGTIAVNGGDLIVENGVIKGTLEGDVSGSATPKIHLSEKPEYGGASKDLYGHVILEDNLNGVKPEPSSDNTNPMNQGVVAKAASPLMVWNALEEAKSYTDEKGIIINAEKQDGTTIQVSKNLNFNDDFVIDENNNLSLKWIEI